MEKRRGKREEKRKMGIYINVGDSGRQRERDRETDSGKDKHIDRDTFKDRYMDKQAKTDTNRQG